MKKYVLSPQYSFVPKEDINDLPIAEIQELLSGNKYALLENKTGSILTLNPTMYEFLTHFQTPVDSDYVVNQYMTMTQGAFEEVKSALTPFFYDMFDRGILVTAKKREVIKTVKPIEVGDAIGRFIIAEILSADAPVKVYLAEDSANNRSVVLKVLDVDTVRTQSDKKYWTKRFYQELGTLQEAKAHPSVCQLLETLEIGQTHVAVLEYIEGGSLYRLIDESTLVTFEQKKNIMTQILDAYAVLHQKGILHGDIHRSNILITNDLHIKIIDFDMSYHQPLRKGEIVVEGGVHEYLPPEKISDSYFELVTARADFRSEVYQLGVIGYFIFYGKLPFEAPTWLDLAQMIREKAAEMGGNMAHPDKSGTEGIDEFLSKALHKNPKERFSSAIEMKNVWQRL